MMKHVKIFIAAAIFFVVTSCGIVTRSSFVPTITQIQIPIDRMEYLGETEISVTYDTYLGWFSKIRAVNGAEYDPSQIQIAVLPSSDLVKNLFIGLSPRLECATYKVFEEFPSADYFLVTRQTSKMTVLVFGREVESKATVKAYRIKN